MRSFCKPLIPLNGAKVLKISGITKEKDDFFVNALYLRWFERRMAARISQRHTSTLCASEFKPDINA